MDLANSSAQTCPVSVMNQASVLGRIKSLTDETSQISYPGDSNKMSLINVTIGKNPKDNQTLHFRPPFKESDLETVKDLLRNTELGKTKIWARN